MQNKKRQKKIGRFAPKLSFPEIAIFPYFIIVQTKKRGIFQARNYRVSESEAKAVKLHYILKQKYEKIESLHLESEVKY